MKPKKSHSALIWDIPLRCWHWLLTISVATSLLTGLFGDIDTIKLHQYSGITVVALIVFRITWGIWGAVYARWHWYTTTPSKILSYFRGRLEDCIHTPPGIALVLLLLAAIALQSTSGLFMTDDIFFEGPLHQFASAALADTARFMHTRLWQLIAALIGVHLTAHLIYGLVLRDPTPLSMFTGHKRIDVSSTHFRTVYLILSLLSGLLSFTILVYYSR